LTGPSRHFLPLIFKTDSVHKTFANYKSLNHKTFIDNKIAPRALFSKLMHPIFL
jgi:hypothetical protein